MSESNIVKEFADGPTADTVDAFGKVAEGPLIKYNPGGFAQFRAETTGLPPARAQFGDEEFWGQLVTPTTTKLDTVPTGPTGPTDLDGTGLSNDQIDAIVKESDDAHKELQDWYRRSSSDDLVDFDKYRLDIPEPKINWDTSDIGYTGYDYRKDPDFLTGDLISADRNFTPYSPPTGPTELPKTPAYIPPPPKDGDKDGPLVRFSPRPAKDRTLTEKSKDDKIASVGVLKPKLTEEASRSLQDILSTIEKPIKAVLGKTRYDVEGPHPKGSDYDNLGKVSQNFTLKLKDWAKGLDDESLKLWETKGIPSEVTGRAPVGPKYGKMLANFVRILKNEENIQTQEYGNLQFLAALNTAALISQYGAIGGAIPVLLTVSDDLMSALNNMTAKRPEMAGNPIQDFVHGTTWVLGKTLQKTYNNTLGQVLPKIKDTRIKDKLGNIDEFMKAPRRPNMGTKTVISMPDPAGTITIPESETPTKRKEVAAEKPEPFVAPEPEPPVTGETIQVKPEEPNNVVIDDPKIDPKPISTLPKVETSGALTVTPTTDPTIDPTIDPNIETITDEVKGVIIRDVGDLEKGLTEIDTSNIETAELDLAELPVTKTLKGEEGQVIKPTQPKKQEEQKGTTIDKGTIEGLGKIIKRERDREATAAERQQVLKDLGASVFQTGFPDMSQDDLDKFRTENKNWIQHGTRNYEVPSGEEIQIQIQLSDIQDQLANADFYNLSYEDIQNLEQKQMDLNLELTNIAPTEIPSPLKFYLDGYSTEDSFILFNAYLKKANQSLDQKFNDRQFKHEQNMQDFQIKLADKFIENIIKESEEGRLSSEKAEQEFEEWKKFDKEQEERRKELEKQEQERAEKILTALKGYLKTDRDRLVKWGLMTQEEADAQVEFADKIAKTEGGLQILHKGGDGKIVPQKDKEGKIKGYAYISKDDAEFLEKYKGGSLEYGPDKTAEGSGLSKRRPNTIQGIMEASDLDAPVYGETIDLDDPPSP